MRSDPPPSPSVRGDDLLSASMPVRRTGRSCASLCRGWCGVVNQTGALKDNFTAILRPAAAQGDAEHRRADLDLTGDHPLPGARTDILQGLLAINVLAKSLSRYSPNPNKEGDTRE